MGSILPSFWLKCGGFTRPRLFQEAQHPTQRLWLLHAVPSPGCLRGAPGPHSAPGTQWQPECRLPGRSNFWRPVQRLSLGPVPTDAAMRCAPLRAVGGDDGALRPWPDAHKPQRTDSRLLSVLSATPAVWPQVGGLIRRPMPRPRRPPHRRKSGGPPGEWRCY